MSPSGRTAASPPPVSRSEVAIWRQLVAVPAPASKFPSAGEQAMSPAAAICGSEPDAGVAATAGLGAEVAAAEPPVFTAVTSTRTAWPASASWSGYSARVASGTSEQPLPAASQRSQR